MSSLPLGSREFAGILFFFFFLKKTQLKAGSVCQLNHIQASRREKQH